MLNGRAMLLGILCITFVAAAFGQDQSDPNVITVTEKINIADLNNNVERLSEAVEKLSGNVEKLTESVNSLNTRVGVLEERTQGTAKTVHVILASIIAPLVVAIIAPIVYYILTQKIMNRQNQEDTAPIQTTQVNQSDPAPSSTPLPKIPDRVEDIRDYIKSDSHATTEKI